MPETPELADVAGVKIFSADIIYHLFDQFKAYTDNFKEEKKKEASEEAVYPCVLQIMPNCVFNKRGPIVLGGDVVEGSAKVIISIIIGIITVFFVLFLACFMIPLAGNCRILAFCFDRLKLYRLYNSDFSMSSSMPGFHLFP